MSRQTSSTLVEVDARCGGCQWSSQAGNALGNAARHHDATGHHVEVSVTRIVHYGDPHAQPEAQLEAFPDTAAAGA